MTTVKYILPACLLLSACTTGGQTGEITQGDSIPSTGMTPEEVAEKFFGNYTGLLGDTDNGELRDCEASIDNRVELEIRAGEGTPPDGEYLQDAQIWLNVTVLVSVDEGSLQQVEASLSEFGDLHFHDPEAFDGVMRGTPYAHLHPERGEAAMSSSEKNSVPLCCGSPLPEEMDIYESLDVWEQPPLVVVGEEGAFAAGGELLDLKVHVEPQGEPTSCLVMQGASDPVRIIVAGSEGFVFAELEGSGSAFPMQGITTFYADGAWADPAQSGAASSPKGAVERVFVTLTLDREGQVLERCISLDVMGIDEPEATDAGEETYNMEVRACAVTCPDAEDCPDLPDELY